MAHTTQTQTATSTKTAVAVALAVVVATVVGTTVGFSQWQSNKAVTVSNLNVNVNTIESDDPIVLRGSGTPDTNYGYALANAGDMNGDGADDLVVTDEVDGAIFGYYGGGDTLSSTADWELRLETHSSIGYSIDSAGDVNADGFDDVIIGDHAETARLYYGSATGPGTGEPDWSATVEAGGDYFGQAVAGVGSLNGDVYDDVAIFTGANSTGGSSVSVYYGSSVGLASTPDWTYSNAYEYLQRSVNLAGADVNGDGYSDVVVGNPEAISGLGYGHVAVFHGSATGLTSARPDFVAWGTSAQEFGGTVASAGDVNTDGYEDVVVGAPSYTNGEDSEGATYVYFGSNTGLSRSRARTESNKADAWMGLAATSTPAGSTGSQVVVSAPYFEASRGADEGRVYLYDLYDNRFRLVGVTGGELYPGTERAGLQLAASNSFIAGEGNDIVVSVGQYDSDGVRDPAVFVFPNIN